MTTWHQRNENQGQCGKEVVRPCICILLGWMDDRAWYYFVDAWGSIGHTFSLGIALLSHADWTK